MIKNIGKENDSPNVCERQLSNPKKSIENVQRRLYDKLTPLDFDTFVPWVCLQWSCTENVVVTRMSQEEYSKFENRRSSSLKSKSSKNLKFKPNECDIDSKKSTTIATKTSATKTSMTKANYTDTVIVRAYYDCRGYLVEIAIIGCPIQIHRKIIQAFSICLPFHSLLTRLTIRRGGLCYHSIYEINKLLTHSNLTDICLDDSFIPEGNYYILLEKKSQLKYLSLNRCSINDSVCKEIAARIHYGLPGSTLRILELGSNLISDMGAQSLGDMLRRNRSLLHINLSGNKIGDLGALAMFKHLTDFQLTRNEILETKRKKLEYTDHRATVFKNCLAEVILRQKEELRAATTSSLASGKSIFFSKHSKTKKSKKSSSIIVEETSTANLAEAKTQEIVGNFSDPFNDNNVVQKGGHSYALGNMTLSSLNLAYNNLEFLSVKRIKDILKYQSVVVKPAGTTGLLKIVIDGNKIPDRCIEYDIIDMFLKKTVIEHDSFAPAPIKKRISTPLRKISNVKNTQ